MREFDVKVGLALDNMIKFRNLCKGQLWDHLSKKLGSEFGPYDIIAGIANYIILDWKHDIIPTPLTLQEVKIIAETVLEKRFPLRETDESVGLTVDQAVNIIFSDPGLYKCYLEYIPKPFFSSEIKTIFREEDSIRPPRDVKKGVKSARKKRDQSIYDVAKKVGVHPSTVSRWESSNPESGRDPQLGNAVKASKLYGIEPEEFVG